ncbi:AAA family ATPase [Helicobacter sp. T3_23-1059]
MTKTTQSKFITSLKASASYKNIKKGFQWDNIPKFAVITGENGSGKTALLEQIDSISNGNTTKNRQIFNIQTSSQVKYFDNIQLELDGYCVGDTNIQKCKENYENIVESEQNGKNGFYKQYISFFKRHNKSYKEFRNMSKDTFYKWLDSVNDINVESSPTIFNERLLVDMFGNYFIKLENCKRRLLQQCKDMRVKEIDEMAERECGINPLDEINKKLEIHYPKYRLEVIIPQMFNEAQLVCIEQDTQNVISLDNISLGEQIIMSLIMWQYENTTLDSIILLLDEPDAHLNPKMAKMLIDILKNVVVKEFDCQVVMTTHSLSSVAYCEENDLFFMENGNIRKIDKKEAIEKLSDGVMTFDNAMSVITQIQKSNKPTLMVEGKLDKLHIENFYKLSKIDKPFEIIDCGGTDNMSHFAIAFKQLSIPKEKILFLCDYDKAGYNANAQIIQQGYTTIYTLDIDNLNQDDDRIRLKNYPLEMLYTLDILKDNKLVVELELKDFISAQLKR